ncbi:hypothetical protein [Actinomadura xylanilytica]|uniref:hypothetical protein n=1 Tax=Actinomadura xylanilytica TaxID=887459 RepID=UPI00255A9FDE|nr:hypothetical protein [Actinomadura xylanilytica]MDL4772402.1 hypothetical protein [Actinomadura xylanilytica]
MTSIDLRTLPDYTGVAEKVQAAAKGVRKAGGEVHETGAEVAKTWTGLAPFYKAPEAGTLLAAMGPVKAQGDTVGSQSGTVASALEEFAQEVAKIQQQMVRLQGEVVAFNQDVMGDPDAMKDDGKRDRYNSLVNQIKGWGLIAFQRAERDCANKINALTGGPHYVPGDFGDDHGGRLPPGYQRYGWITVPGNVPLPWGRPIETPDPWWQRTLKGFGGAGWGMVTGTFSLVDVTDPEGLERSWKGLYQLAYGASPSTWIEGAAGDKEARKALTAWKHLGQELIGWDKAKKGNYAGAAGQAAFNIPTTIFSFSKLGRGGAAAGRGVGRAAGAVAPTLTGLGNAGAKLVRNVADGINGLRGGKMPQIIDPKTVRLHLPDTPARNPAGLPTVGGLRREIDQIGKPHEPAFNELDRRPRPPGDDLPNSAKPGSPADHPKVPAMAGGARPPHEINAGHSPPGSKPPGGEGTPPGPEGHPEGPSQPPDPHEGTPGHPDSNGSENPPPHERTPEDPDTTPPDLYRAEDGKLHRTGDIKDGSYRTPDGKLHFDGDPPGSHRNDINHRLHGPSGGFLSDPHASKPYDHLAKPGKSHPHIPTPDAASKIAELIRDRNKFANIRKDIRADIRKILGISKFGETNYFGIKDIHDLGIEKWEKKEEQIRLRIERDPNLSPLEKGRRLDALDSLSDLTEHYRESGVDLNRTSERMGMVGAEDLLRKLGPHTKLTPLSDAPGRPGTVDMAAVSADRSRLTIIEAKGGTSTLGGRLVEGLKRAQQGSPEYLEFILAHDPDLGRAFGADSHLKDILMKKLQKNELRIDAYLVNVDQTGRVSWSQFDLTRHGNPFAPKRISGLNPTD